MWYAVSANVGLLPQSDRLLVFRVYAAGIRCPRWIRSGELPIDEREAIVSSNAGRDGRWHFRRGRRRIERSYCCKWHCWERTLITVVNVSRLKCYFLKKLSRKCSIYSMVCNEFTQNSVKSKLNARICIHKYCINCCCLVINAGITHYFNGC